MSTSMRTLARGLWITATAQHKSMYSRMGRLLDYRGAKPRGREELLDTAFALSQAADLIKELSIRLEEGSRQLQKLICAMSLETEDVGSIHGRWATGTPDAKVVPRIPTLRGDPEAYAQMCNFFNAPADGLFRPHWPTIRDWATARVAEGRSLPVWIRADYMEYVVKMRATGALNEGNTTRRS